MIDIRLAQWATPSEIEMINAVNTHGSYRKAAPTLGVAHTTIMRAMDRLEVRAAVKGYAPANDLHHDVPEPFYVERVTSHYHEGELKNQWVKSRIEDKERWQQILETIESRCGNIKPRPLVPLNPNVTPSEELCHLITMTDCHVGALAWDREAGEDWDLTIAKDTLTSVFVGMIRTLPSAGTCVISQLGDFLHTDGLLPTTPAHGHILDADSRFQKMSEVAVDIIEDVVNAALECHGKVHLILAEGNHDESSSVWLRVMFKRLYRNDPRVTVEDSPLPYYAYQHGNVMLMFHHGHKLRPASLPMWFATKFSVMWGLTTARYGHSGHQHHLHEKDEMGARWLQHPTLAAPDAYSARGGWLSPREAIGITYDLDGESSRFYARPAMFRVMDA